MQVDNALLLKTDQLFLKILNLNNGIRDCQKMLSEIEKNGVCNLLITLRDSTHVSLGECLLPSAQRKEIEQLLVSALINRAETIQKELEDIHRALEVVEEKSYEKIYK